jgi:hypothetical protein
MQFDRISFVDGLSFLDETSEKNVSDFDDESTFSDDGFPSRFLSEFSGKNRVRVHVWSNSSSKWETVEHIGPVLDKTKLTKSFLLDSREESERRTKFHRRKSTRPLA